MKLFVAKLDYAVTSQDLQTVFEEYGNVVSCNVVNDRETGRSKGFGFVEMESADDARTAINQLDGSELRGRQMVVKEAEDRKRTTKSW
ncbi:MAG: RNA-binding protein [Salibacteraceae bacterium]|jgi:RNA recognition motif-containing protein|nr:RNA-binding protein [Salibacteraceae bacterium]MDP4687876.1 RNA-binding protein [Salibacteraceae bacterium]MDP4764311.1 RNA-binding protein [Salibacteraceae bacterium]MDP4842942.1 RNA-binding protein [Salibacteraceae bacterium]MDP4933239.1 RNA-binding protein [Salibacteraceae bacterium]